MGGEMSVTSSYDCPNCGGRGRIDCTQCHGEGYYYPGI